MWIEATDGRIINSDHIAVIKKTRKRIVASLPDEVSVVQLTGSLDEPELDEALRQLLKTLNG